MTKNTKGVLGTKLGKDGDDQTAPPQLLPEGFELGRD